MLLSLTGKSKTQTYTHAFQRTQGQWTHRPLVLYKLLHNWKSCKTITRSPLSLASVMSNHRSQFFSAIIAYVNASFEHAHRTMQDELSCWMLLSDWREYLRLGGFCLDSNHASTIEINAENWVFHDTSVHFGGFTIVFSHYERFLLIVKKWTRPLTSQSPKSREQSERFFASSVF
jgi:hypothetical protein